MRSHIALVCIASLLFSPALWALQPTGEIINCTPQTCLRVTGNEPNSLLTASGSPVNTLPQGTVYTVRNGKALVLKKNAATVAAAKQQATLGSVATNSGGQALIGGLTTTTWLLVGGGLVLLGAAASGGGGSSSSGASGTTAPASN